MHIMEGDCDKSGGLLTGERAPDLLQSDGHKTIVEGHPETAEGAEEPISKDVADLQVAPSPVALSNGDHPESIPEEVISLFVHKLIIP